jgi:hypothetical protein
VLLVEAEQGLQHSSTECLSLKTITNTTQPRNSLDIPIYLHWT